MADPVAADLLAAASGVLDESRLSALARCLEDLQPGVDPERRYRRLVTALDRLSASGPGGDRAAGFLGRPVVLARMSLAAEVNGCRRSGGRRRRRAFAPGAVLAALRPRAGPAAAPLVRRRHRSRFTAAVGSRRWGSGARRGPAERRSFNADSAGRQSKFVARLNWRGCTCAQARMMCTAMRADLGRQAAVLSRRQVGAFEDRAQGGAPVTVEFDDLMCRRLTELIDRAGHLPSFRSRRRGVPLPRRRSTDWSIGSQRCWASGSASASR